MAPADFEMPVPATEGFKDGGAYDTHRPSYPPEAVDALLERVKVAGKAHARIVEIGCGTGKFTEILARRFESFEIVAVEPLDSMREKLEAKKLAGVKVFDGHAGSVPVEDDWVDAVIVAQAFHWFATDEALVEIARVLKPTAVLGLIWNIEDYNKPKAWPASTNWEQRLNDLVHSLPNDGHPRFRHSKWQDVFTGKTPSNPVQALRDGAPPFSLPLGEQRIPFSTWLDTEALWARMGTLSQIAVLDHESKADLRRRIEEVLAGDDVERNEKGDVKLHGQTYFAWTDKIGGYY